MEVIPYRMCQRSLPIKWVKEFWMYAVVSSIKDLHIGAGLLLLDWPLFWTDISRRRQIVELLRCFLMLLQIAQKLLGKKEPDLCKHSSGTWWEGGRETEDQGHKLKSRGSCRGLPAFFFPSPLKTLLVSCGMKKKLHFKKEIDICLLERSYPCD